MRFLGTLLSIVCFTQLPIATAWAEPDFAVRAEGYLGYSNLDLGVSDFDTFQGGGSGSVSVIFDQIYLQNYDRRYFKPSCGGVVLIGRIC